MPALRSGSVRRRKSDVLVVGAVEPEVRSWLRGAGHETRSVAGVDAALAALAAEPVDLVVADRERAGGDASAVCGALRADPRLGDAWLLAITGAARGRMNDAALDVGADDYLHRPFTRAQLLARTRAGLRAVQHRSDAALLRALLLNVPGAIYRSAWHAGHRVELISDEIERISGHPAANFIASTRRTIVSVIHPDDRESVMRAVAAAREEPGKPFAREYRIVRADEAVRWVLDRGQLVEGGGERLWMDGAVFDVTERREVEAALRRKEIEAARATELRASSARIVEAADAARRRIERDLHDGAQQRLVALVLDVGAARARLASEPDSAGPFLDRLGSELADASAELRELARGIHPVVLTERGLAPAISALAGRCAVPVEVGEVPAERLPPTVEATAYFTVSEALTNVARYARATHATVRLVAEAGSLLVEVRDDGVGGARAAAGSGLSGLTDRVGAIGGALTVVSPPAQGTLVRAVLPLETPKQRRT
ncbi:MAG: PAS domain-containing protein [Solirubrobacteraceae bacterium]